MLAIKKYRTKKGWKQSELAEKCGVAHSTIGMWEIGERKPDIFKLKKIANLLDCTTDELLELIDCDAK